jgi:acetyl esterase
MPLHPALKPVLEQLEALPGPKLHELPPEQARLAFAALPLPAPEIALPEVRDLRIPGPAGEIPLRLYRPREGRLPVLVYFHGGGWVIGDLESHDPVCRELAQRSGCAVLAVHYRLAPEHPYPAAVEDCFAATCWVAEHAAELDLAGDRLAVGGDSAGGNLAAVVSLLARDRGGPRLRLQLLVYPVTDADFTRASYAENGRGFFLERPMMDWFWGHYVPDPARRREPECAPLRAVNLVGLPPALVLTAEFDPLRDEGEAYAVRLAAAGVPTEQVRYAGMIHGFYQMGGLLEDARAALERSATAVRWALTEP